LEAEKRGRKRRKRRKRRKKRKKEENKPMTGILMEALTSLTRGISKPELVPSLSMQFSRISPAPRASEEE
jgi:hypothetical protein